MEDVFTYFNIPKEIGAIIRKKVFEAEIELMAEPIYKSLWFKRYHVPTLLDKETNYPFETYPCIGASIYPHELFALDINFGGVRSIQDPNNPDGIGFTLNGFYGRKIYTRCYCSKKKGWHMCDANWASKHCPKTMKAIKESQDRCGYTEYIKSLQPLSTEVSVI